VLRSSFLYPDITSADLPNVHVRPVPESHRVLVHNMAAGYGDNCNADQGNGREEKYQISIRQVGLACCMAGT